MSDTSSRYHPAPRAIFASDPQDTRGRLYHEEESAFRSPFQRDRDRIIHSSAFRRLKHKTQVFVEHEGDYYRTRLTHSIEVAQVARTLSRTLGLNEDLAEAVALAHDLGHTPFGHTGEDALHECMVPYGGFDHNAQALRIVTELETRYADFDGLNLTWETLEGLAKHNGPVAEPLPWALADYAKHHDLELHTFASAEAQVAAISDDIAYNHHDLHDGLRAELFSTDELAELPILKGCFAAVDARYPGLNYYRRRHEARFSPDVGGAANPVRFDTASAALSAARRFGDVDVGGEARVDRFDFADSRDVTTANNINNDDRDRTVWRLAGQTGYGRAEGLGGFVRFEGVISDYEDAFDDNGFARDSEGLGVRVGAAAKLSGVTTVRGHVGFRGQYYEDDGPARLNDDEVEALLLGIAINTDVTALTSVYADVRRDVFETTLAFSPGGVITRGEIGADHELLRNLLLSARLGGRMFDFDGIDREDFGVFFRFGAVYSIDRRFALEAGFEHETVQSTGSAGGVDASVNRVMLRLAARP